MARSPFLSPERLDPATAWQPWEPDAKQPWDLKWAGHLYRRAGFGAHLSELREAVRRGHHATLDLILQGQPKAEQFEAFVVAASRGANDAYSLRGWWLYVMLRTPHPLREKLTLFWHNHFATSITKVQSAAMMAKQNLLFRRHALGKFGPLLQEVSKDPAMLVWLDSNSNLKGKANENYARELMELFSLGVGHYSEQDIREAARAFTGWHTGPDDGSNDRYEFEPRDHDDGPKTIFGKTGNWNGEDVVRLCLEQPVAARFLVRKLYHFFIREGDSPPDELLEPLAKSFRESGYDIAALVKTMLGSRLFFSDYAYRHRLKSPVEFTVGSVLAVVPPEVARSGTLPQQPLVTKLDAMGQQLFAPPNVKGWPGGKTWLNTSTVLARHNFAQELASGNLQPGRRPAGNRFEEVQLQAEEERLAAEEAARQAQGGGKPPEAKPRPSPVAYLDVAAAVRKERAEKPEEVAGLLLDLFLQGPVRAEARAKLVKFLGDGSPKGDALHWRIRDAAHAVMTMPEYQLA